MVKFVIVQQLENFKRGKKKFSSDLLVVQDHLVRLKAYESVFVANATHVQFTNQLHCNLHFFSFQFTWPLATIMFYKYFSKLHNKNNFHDKTLHLGDRKNYIAISLSSVIKEQYVRAWICNKLHTENITDLFLLSLCALILYLSCAQCCWWWMSDNGAPATFAKRQFAAITLHDCVGIYCGWHLIFGLIYLYRSISLFHSSLRLFCVLMPSAALLGSDEMNRITTIFKRDNS